MATDTITVPYRTAGGRWRGGRSRSTGPTTARSSARRAASGSSVALMQKPVEALSQSFLRTKARDYASFRQVADGAARQLVQQHGLRRRRRATSPTSTRSSSRGATTASTGPGRWTAAIPRPTGRGCTRWTRPRTCSTRRPAGSRTPTTGRTRRRARTAPTATRFPRYMDTAGENPRGDARDAGAGRGASDFTLETLHRGGVRHLSARVREPGPGAGGGVRRACPRPTR